MIVPSGKAIPPRLLDAIKSRAANRALCDHALQKCLREVVSSLNQPYHPNMTLTATEARSLRSKTSEVVRIDRLIAMAAPHSNYVYATINPAVADLLVGHYAAFGYTAHYEEGNLLLSW